MPRQRHHCSTPEQVFPARLEAVYSSDRVLTRRRFSSFCAALLLAAKARAGAPRATSGVAPEGSDLEWRELELSGSQRALVLSPARAAPDQTYPGLLLFHGLGETRSAELALHAWRTSYGAEDSYARLLRPPLSFDPGQLQYIEPGQARALEATLAQKPFRGLVLICPVTPNPHRSKNPQLVLDRYSEWIEHTLLPAARAQAPLDAARGIGVDGCSMGGYVAAEVFLRKAHLFRSFGVVQPAIGAFRTPPYAAELARAQGGGSLRGIHLQTSTRDPYRDSVEVLSRHLSRQGARFTMDVLPGPHDQRWLRATGTLSMLAWHDYTLG
jgi:acetyl esterase/lipase